MPSCRGRLRSRSACIAPSLGGEKGRLRGGVVWVGGGVVGRGGWDGAGSFEVEGLLFERAASLRGDSPMLTTKESSVV